MSARTIYCTATSYASERDQVFANRGMTMASAATRKSPHVFQFLRQVEVLTRAGHGGAAQQFEVPLTACRVEVVRVLAKHHKDWTNTTAVSKAFALGKTESMAVVNLQSYVNPAMVAMLKGLVGVRGMRGYLSHDLLARGLLNTGHTSASGSCEAWASPMTNLDDGKVATWQWCGSYRVQCLCAAR